jgi:hypothetical protein
VADQGDRNIVDELTAIKAVVEALQPLGEGARRHVMAYVAEALGVRATPAPNSDQTRQPAFPVSGMAAAAPEPVMPAGATVDIRNLKEQKQPRTATEMASVVAYYLSELAPLEDRRTVVTAADIEKYFKQANFRLPGRIAQTLPDAARAGYFDATGRGQYKLNPVGYNLVAHGLPGGAVDPPTRPTRVRKTSARGAGSKTTTKSPTARKTRTTRQPKESARGAGSKRSSSKRG